MQNVFCMQMAKGVGEEKEEEGLPGRRRKVSRGIPGGAKKSCVLLAALTMVEEEK